MTPRAERLYIALCKFLIVASVFAALLALAACSCRNWGAAGYCPPPFAPRTG